MLTYAILTFGCRVNQADSFEFEDELRARGGVEAAPDVADLLIINTCSVTGAADQGARRAIRRVSRDNPNARIVVTGCYATRKPDDLAALPNVVTVIPNTQKDELVQLLDERFSLTTADRFVGGDAACGSTLAPGAMGRTAYPLRVQTGCEESCAFCIIPSTRGRSRSRTVAEVLDEVRRIAAAGYKEIWLVGVHLGSFGRDLEPPSSLPTLLRALDAAPGDVSFRISSLEPMECPPDVVDLVVRSGRFAPHFHLPLQHASDRVLAAMRRPYTFELFRNLAGRIRESMSAASIGTDLIVGFPGEADEDASECIRRVEQLPLSYAHVFPYSDRPGTAATSMSGKVEPPQIQARARALRRATGDLAARFIASQVGAVRPGLTLEDGTLVLTDNFLKVRIPPGLLRNTRVRVRIETPDLAGSIVSGPCGPACGG